MSFSILLKQHASFIEPQTVLRLFNMICQIGSKSQNVAALPNERLMKYHPPGFGQIDKTRNQQLQTPWESAYGGAVAVRNGQRSTLNTDKLDPQIRYIFFKSSIKTGEMRQILVSLVKPGWTGPHKGKLPVSWCLMGPHLSKDLSRRSSVCRAYIPRYIVVDLQYDGLNLKPPWLQTSPAKEWTWILALYKYQTPSRTYTLPIMDLGKR